MSLENDDMREVDAVRKERLGELFSAYEHLADSFLDLVRISTGESSFTELMFQLEDFVRIDRPDIWGEREIIEKALTGVVDLLKRSGKLQEIPGTSGTVERVISGTWGVGNQLEVVDIPNS